MADDAPAAGKHKGLKLPPALEKHKVLLFAGMLGVLFLVYFLYKGQGGSGAGAASTSPAALTDPGTDPTSGLSASDLGDMLSGMSGLPGPAGPAGVAGPAGPAAKMSIWQLAKQELIAGGNKNPTQGQIDRKRRKILGQKPAKAPKATDHKPVKKAAVQAMPAAHMVPAAHKSQPPAKAGKKN